MWYVEDSYEPRTKLGACFSNRLEVADGALEDGNLRNRIAGVLEFRADLLFEVGGIADLIDEDLEETFGGEQTIALQLIHGLITDRDIGAADVKNEIVVSASSDPLKS